MLLLFRTASADQGTCVAVQTAPSAKGTTVTLSNHCDKDITAYHVRIENERNGSSSASVEFLPAMADPSTATDVFRKSISRSMSLDDVAPSSVSVLVDAVIFSDNFAAGESDAISELIRIRQYNVRKMQGRLKLLRSFATWSSASAIRLKLEEARQTRDPNTLFLQRLSQQLEKSDAASWEAYVARQIDWTERAAQLFEGSVKALESHSREPR